jgi:hypothetical protein
MGVYLKLVVYKLVYFGVYIVCYNIIIGVTFSPRISMVLMLLVCIAQQIVPSLLSKPFLLCSLFTNLEPFCNYVQLFRTITQEAHKTLQARRAHSKQKITIFRNNKTKWISM